MQRLEAHELALHKVFCSDYDFRIPDYQRPYDWDEEQAEQLLGDLEEALDRKDAEPYFLGSIVLVKAANSPLADVIDGQQRLTTLTILLSILRDLALKSQHALAGAVVEGLDKMIREPGDVIQDLQPKPRLTLRQRDAEFFRDHVQAPGSTTTMVALLADTLKTDAQRAMVANARVLRDRLEAWSDSRRLDLSRLLSQQTYLVAVSTPDLDSAHRVFSVMNSRGKDLSPTDIFKSQVIGAIEPSASVEYARKWEDAEESLGRSGFAALFADIRMIFAQEKARYGLLREFKERVLERYLQDGLAKEFVDDVLVPYAQAAALIRDLSYQGGPGSEKVNLWLRRLQWLDNSDWRPAALWALHHHKTDPAWLDAFFRKLERVAASMHIRRIYAPTRAQSFAILLKSLASGNGLNAEQLTLQDEDRTETINRLATDIYLRGQASCRYVLLRLDEILGDEDVPTTYDLSKISIEHVLPQNPKSGSQWLRDFTDGERQEWTHKLANLVLLSGRKNAQVQNSDFLTKRDKYLQRGVVSFALTVQVLGQSEWSPDVLSKRQAELLRILTGEWHLS